MQTKDFRFYFYFYSLQNMCGEVIERKGVMIDLVNISGTIMKSG